MALIVGPTLERGNSPAVVGPTLKASPGAAARPTADPSPSAAATGPTADAAYSTPPVSLNVSLVLFRAGAAAGAQPGGWPDAAYWRTVSSYHQGKGPTLRRESWMGHKAIGVLKDPRVSREIISLDVGTFGSFTWDQLYALPTNSRALEAKLRATSLNGGRDDNSELFTLVGGLLAESPAPPALRKALWEIAARVPGVTLVGAVKDSAGRPGMEIRRGDEGYILDPRDGQLLEQYEGTPEPVMEAPGGTNWRSTILERGPADSAPEPRETRGRPKSPPS